LRNALRPGGRQRVDRGATPCPHRPDRCHGRWCRWPTCRASSHAPHPAPRGNQNERTGIAHPQAFAHGYAVRREVIDLLKQGRWRQHYAVADQTHDVLAQDAGRNQVQHGLLAIDHQCVAGIVSALKTRHSMCASVSRSTILPLPSSPTASRLRRRSCPKFYSSFIWIPGLCPFVQFRPLYNPLPPCSTSSRSQPSERAEDESPGRRATTRSPAARSVAIVSSRPSCQCAAREYPSGQQRLLKPGATTGAGRC